MNTFFTLPFSRNPIPQTTRKVKNAYPNRIGRCLRICYFGERICYFGERICYFGELICYFGERICYFGERICYFGELKNAKPEKYYLSSALA
ncbi:hypothetical protein [uncultured Nostoc sp.]|uniref:hypothetical protein n=1 Tax=uncultured Nostoc sp. TaxID=340711 RepID=UPI0035CC32F5